MTRRQCTSVLTVLTVPPALVVSVVLGVLVAAAPVSTLSQDARAVRGETPVQDERAQLLEGELRFQSQADWDFVLPAEHWTPVTHSIDISGLRFAVRIESDRRLVVDTDNDGHPDLVAGAASGPVVLQTCDPDGKPFRYALRLRHDGRNWEWSTGGAMVGRAHGTRIVLIDLDGNGTYDDYGVDALVTGDGQAASYLSPIARLGGSLHYLAVSRDGRRVTTRPYRGPTAHLDVHKGFVCEGVLVAAIFACGKNSFDLANPDGGDLVPSGEYHFVSGMAKMDARSVLLAPGRMLPLVLAGNATLTLEWGGPLVAEFSYDVQGDRLRVYSDVNFFGRAGVEYHTFLPVAKAPKVLVHDRASGRLVQYGRMGGCCGRGYSAFVTKVPRDLELDVHLEHRRALFGEILGHPRLADRVK